MFKFTKKLYTNCPVLAIDVCLYSLTNSLSSSDKKAGKVINRFFGDLVWTRSCSLTWVRERAQDKDNRPASQDGHRS